MHVASLELCKELLELSGWEPEDWFDPLSGELETSEDKAVLDADNGGDAGLVPAYDLGFLLRRLQPIDESFYFGVMQMKISCLRQKNYETNGTKSIEYSVQWRAFQKDMSDFTCESTTPENALCKLAIELFKKGTLTKQTEGE